MVTIKPPFHRSRQRGASLLEVLITVVITAFGLLAIAGLQVRLQLSEMESYQRAQALVLLGDMASRLGANPRNAPDYVTPPMGAGATCTSPSKIPTRAQMDLSEWCWALQGAGETMAGNTVGAMLGGRGCIEGDVGSGVWMVTVVWQGLSPLRAPPADVACGRGSYDQAEGPCVDDRCRRYVTTVMRKGVL